MKFVVIDGIAFNLFQVVKITAHVDGTILYTADGQKTLVNKTPAEVKQLIEDRQAQP